MATPSASSCRPKARRRFVSDWKTARERGIEKYRATRALIRAVEGADEVERTLASFVLKEFYALQKVSLNDAC